MKLLKTFTAIACAVAFLSSASMGLAESCCVKSKAKGEDCKHPCCVAAHKDKKTCDKCQADASCCDKAVAAGKACDHPCCVTAAKDKKACAKCNAKKDAKKEQKT